MEATIHQRGQAWRIRARQGEGCVSVVIDEPIVGQSPNNGVVIFAENADELIKLGYLISSAGRELRAAEKARVADQDNWDMSVVDGLQIPQEENT